MKKFIFIIFLIWNFFLQDHSWSFDNNKENYNRDKREWLPYTLENINQGVLRGGHDTITSEAMVLKKEVHKADSDGGKKFKEWADEQALPKLRAGAHDEDTNRWLNFLLNDPPIEKDGWGNFNHHFYNPDTGKGLRYVWGARPATERARDFIREIRRIQNCRPWGELSDQERRRVEYLLGRTLHLIQDMGNPSHARDDIHIFHKPFEDFVRDHWGKIIGSESFQRKVNVEAYWAGGYEGIGGSGDPEAYIRSLAGMSQRYPTEGELLDVVVDWETGRGEVVVNEERLRRNVEDLIPQAVLYSAGFIDRVYRELVGGGQSGDWMGKGRMLAGLGSGFYDLARMILGSGEQDCIPPIPDPPNPAGDHPDDRFDVSDEYYWEREFGLGHGELTEWFLRTGVKKGKIGLWYSKRLMELFFEGRARYRDAPKEVKEAIEAEFERMKKKLAQRESEAERDWKGAPDIALFTNGFINPSISLLLKVGEPVRFLDLEFNPDIVRDHPVIWVPTGGFYGLKNSQLVKRLLEEYVGRGGTLVVLGQRHGYDWAMVPTPADPVTGERRPLFGYGYQEDQSCLFHSVYIDTYHPILSGLSNSMANIGVDGYFTSYPEKATVLLRRVANGQPAMMVYPYGEGQVIATTLYTDFALTHHQANDEEIKLIQNIIAWAKRPGLLPEVKVGQSLDVEVEVSNFTDEPAGAIRLILLDPMRKVIGEEKRAIFLPAGQKTTVLVSVTSLPTHPLGIYHIDYILLDHQGLVLQPQVEADTGRFVISNPPRVRSPDRPIWFSVSTSSQDVFFGFPFDYTFHIFNNTNEARELKIKRYMRHTGRQREWSVRARPNEETRVSGSDLFTDRYFMFETMVAWLEDEKGKEIGRYELSFKGVSPSVWASLQTDRSFYSKADRVRVQVWLRNGVRLDLPCEMKVRIQDPGGQEVFEETRKVFLVANGREGLEVPFSFSPNSSVGTYAIRMEVVHEGRVLYSGASRFNLLETRVKVNPSIPLALTSGENRVSFKLENEGKIPVLAGVLEVVLRDPEGVVVFSGSQSFQLALGEERRIEVPLLVPPLRFGTYTLIYSQSDESRVGRQVTVDLPNRLVFDFTLDQETYAVRQEAKLRVALKNTGRFHQEGLSIAVSSKALAYSESQDVSLLPGGESVLVFGVSIPGEMGPGRHDLAVWLILPSGSVLQGSCGLMLRGSELGFDLSMGRTNYEAGEGVGVTVENRGGVDTSYTIKQVLLMDSRGVVLFQGGEASGIIASGERREVLEVLIPSQAAEGSMVLKVKGMDDRKPGEEIRWERRLEVRGLRAKLSARTDKEAYFGREEVWGLVESETSAPGVLDGRLRVVVSEVSGNGDEGATHFLPKGRPQVFLEPVGVAVGLDGSVYVLDRRNCQVQKFDSEGRFLKKWGGVGEGWGKFSEPVDIAVGLDGSVYVAEDWNGCVHRFDSEGSFLSQWGCWGRGYGRRVAVGPDGHVYIGTNLYRVEGEGRRLIEDNYILKMDSHWKVMGVWGWHGRGYRIEGAFYWIQSLSVGLDGSIYVLDKKGIPVQKFDRDGRFVSGWGEWRDYGNYGPGRFGVPQGIRVGLDGSVYVLDEENVAQAIVQRFDGAGNFLMGWGSFGEAEGEFSWPRGIGVGLDGSVYVADTMNQRIQKFKADGVYEASWGSFGAGAGKFIEPLRVALGPDGSVYVGDHLDYWNRRVQQFDREGNFVRSWSIGGSSWRSRGYWGLAVGPDGSVYVADGSIRKFDGGGNLIGEWKSCSWAGRQWELEAFALTVSADGFIYTTGSGRVHKFDGEGNCVWSWGEECREVQRQWECEGERIVAWAMALDGEGNLYISDGDWIRKYDPSGNRLMEWGGRCVLYEWGERGAQKRNCDGKFNGAMGLAVGPDGSVYVADYGNRRIQKFDRQGSFVMKWGADDGVESLSFSPTDVALGPDGWVYVVNWEESRVKRYRVEERFLRTIPVNQAGGMEERYTLPIGVLDTSGRLYLQATLVNALGQRLAEAHYPFYLFQGDVGIFWELKKVYKKGEGAEVIGRLMNRSSIPAENLSFFIWGKVLGQERVLLELGPFAIPAFGNYPFRFSIPTEVEGWVGLKGRVIQSGGLVSEVSDGYRVVGPWVFTSIEVPSVVGNDPFSIEVRLENRGLVEVSLGLEVLNWEGRVIGRESFRIPPGESHTVAIGQEIHSDETFTFRFTGDLQGLQRRAVRYGLSAGLYLEPQGLYAEGVVGIPFQLRNDGSLAGNFEVRFSLNAAVREEMKRYALGPGESIQDLIYFDLPEGDYEIRALCEAPRVEKKASFQVRKETKAWLKVMEGKGKGEGIPVEARVGNLGAKAIDGVLQISLRDGEEVLWSSDEVFLRLNPNEERGFFFTINPLGLMPGSYTLQGDFRDLAGKPLALALGPLMIKGPSFQIVQVPGYHSFIPGEEAQFSFRVKNIGNQEGEFELIFKTMDLGDLCRREWLGPGEEKEIAFSIPLPLDLEEKDYFATYELKGSREEGAGRGQVIYHLAGLKLDVRAWLDKENYRDGEMAQLRLAISSSQSAPLSLFSRVNYAGFETKESFYLNREALLSFSIPLPKITGEKLFYGIYHESGRSIHLNSLYIHKEAEAITVRTDKQVYKPGETVSVSILGSAQGILMLSGPGGYAETFAFAGPVTRTFKLPIPMMAGTYYLNYQLSSEGVKDHQGSHPFDVDGLKVRVKEALLDKAKYAASDTIQLCLTVESNQDHWAMLKIWLVDPEKNYSLAGTWNIELSKSSPLLENKTIPFQSQKLGLHRLVYGIYAGDLLLCSGAEAFDLGEALLLGLTTDRKEYPNGDEPVVVKASLMGSLDATLDLMLDGKFLQSHPLSLSGFAEISLPLWGLGPGPHSLVGLLRAGGFTSSRESSFLMGTNLPDLTVFLSYDPKIVDGKMKIWVTVRNQGKSPSSPTRLYLYDGLDEGRLLSSWEVKGLEPAEAQSFDFLYDCRGEPGSHTFWVRLDSLKGGEFNIANNEAKLSISVPFLAMETILAKETFGHGEKILIETFITNLAIGSSEPFFLRTEVEDSFGALVMSQRRSLPPIEGEGSLKIEIPWEIARDLPEGLYRVCQWIEGIGVGSQASFKIQVGLDFSLSADRESQKVELSEAVQFILKVMPGPGFTGSVSLSPKDCPSVLSAYFDPNPLDLSAGPKESLLKIIPTSQVQPIQYDLKVKGEGSNLSRELPLSVAFTDFALRVYPISQRIRKPLGAQFTIRLNPINGFEGEVRLSVEGIPRGMQGELSQEKVTLPAEVTLSLFPSKGLRPGEYPLQVTARGRVLSRSVSFSLTVDPHLPSLTKIVTVPARKKVPEVLARVFDVEGRLINDFVMPDTRHTVKIAGADVDGDGWDELLVAIDKDPAFSDPPHLLVMGREGKVRNDFALNFFGTDLITLAVGDVDGDGIEEIALGSYIDPLKWRGRSLEPNGGRGMVRIYKIIDGELFDTGFCLFPFEDKGYRGAPQIALGDVDGDGKMELIAIPADEYPAPLRVRIYKIDMQNEIGQWKPGVKLVDHRLFSIYPWGLWGLRFPWSAYGATVAAGDVDGDGRAEVVIGGGLDFYWNSQVWVLKYEPKGLSDWRVFPAYPGLGIGVNVAVADLDGDGIGEILTGPGPGFLSEPWVKIFRADGSLIREFLGHPLNLFPRHGLQPTAGVFEE